MPPRNDLPHIDISAFVSTTRYRPPRRAIGDGAAPRIREAHGRRLLDQLHASFRESKDAELPEGAPEPAPGAYYEIELRKDGRPEAVELKSKKILAGATRTEPESGTISTVLYVPDDKIPHLEKILNDYITKPLNKKNDPPQKARFDPIENIRKANLLAFWTDEEQALPRESQETIWWEVWCHRGYEEGVVNTFRSLGSRVAAADLWMSFEEAVVVPVYARRADIEIALLVTDGISELRRGTDTPVFFVEDERERQYDWAVDLAERTIWPGLQVPRVCLLDTGVNRAHVLIEPALAETDLQTVNPDWIVTDDRRGHGTRMAGLALFGDLMPRLRDAGEHRLAHRLESVRILPADGFPANDPVRLGTITNTAVALAEQRNPEADRVFCMATTNEDRSGDLASTWSSAIDRSAAGRGVADEDRKARLFFISGGNLPNDMNASDFSDAQNYPIEDPAQAWNAITVGGYTDKVEIDPADASFEGWEPFASVGDSSPFSRRSVGWRSGKTPIKPEIVLEAGNRAISADKASLIDCPHLEVLTTGPDVGRVPFATFRATSAATADAARMAARLRAEFPNHWPEMTRALIIHSAEWTDAMWAKLKRARSKKEAVQLVRTYGYGVPSYERAAASATNRLALIAQREIQPYRKGDAVTSNECHYYALPMPKDVLQQYGDEEFVLKVTLSYFVEPNPGKSAAIDPQNYQSFGLRFDLKRPTETLAVFKRRNNDLEARGDGDDPAATDPKWVLGPDAVSAGSLHCDVWRGTGAQLAARDALCIKPVGGWWKKRTKREVCEQKARYALVVTINSPNTEIDLHTPVTTIVDQAIDIESAKIPVST